MIETSSPENTASWDSVRHLNFILALEQRFGVQFDPEDIENTDSIGAVVSLVSRKLGRD